VSDYDFYAWQTHPSGLLVPEAEQRFWTNVSTAAEPAALTFDDLLAVYRQYKRQYDPLPDVTRQAELDEPFLRMPVEKLPEETW
jgi:hypothetical protein